MRALAMSLGLVVLFGSVVAHADTWTVLAYFAADNNLEPEMLNNVVEATKIGSGANLNILFQLDRGYAPAINVSIPGVAYFSGVKRLIAKKDTLMELQDLGDINMGQGETLADFIKWGMEQYPADHYAVILADHGGAFYGCCEDGSLGTDLSLAEMAKGLVSAMPAGRPFDIIGFDQCLMANLEVAWSLRSAGKWLVASEELEPGAGWNWTVWLQKIVDTPSVTPAELGKTIADGFKANNADNESVTLSVFDLGQVNRLVEEVKLLGTALRAAVGTPEKWIAVAKARANADQFGIQKQGQEATSIDLGGFAANLSSLTDVSASAASTLAALRAAVYYKNAGSLHTKAEGLSIYIPLKEVNQIYGSIPFSTDTSWGDFVTSYAAVAKRDSAPPSVEVTPISGEGSLVTGRTTGNDVNLVGVVLATQDNADTVFLGEIPTAQGGGDASGTGGTVSYQFDGSWPMLTDGTKDIVAPLFGTTKYASGHTVQTMPVELDVAGTGKFVDVELRFDIDVNGRSGRLLGAFDGSNSTAALVELQVNSVVRPRRVVIAPTGDCTSSVGSAALSGKNLSIHAAAVTITNLQIGFRATDLVGNSQITLTSLKGSTNAQTSSGGCSVAYWSPARSSKLLLLALALLGLAFALRRGLRQTW